MGKKRRRGEGEGRLGDDKVRKRSGERKRLEKTNENQQCENIMAGFKMKAFCGLLMLMRFIVTFSPNFLLQPQNNNLAFILNTSLKCYDSAITTEGCSESAGLASDRRVKGLYLKFLQTYTGKIQQRFQFSTKTSEPSVILFN